MPVAVLILHLKLPGCSSLKEKRGRIKPVLARLQREFNVSTAELDRQDHWQESILGCAALNSDAVTAQRTLQSVLDFTSRNFPDLDVVDHSIETL